MPASLVTPPHCGHAAHACEADAHVAWRSRQRCRSVVLGGAASASLRLACWCIAQQPWAGLGAGGLPPREPGQVRRQETQPPALAAVEASTDSGALRSS